MADSGVTWRQNGNTTMTASAQSTGTLHSYNLTSISSIGEWGGCFFPPISCDWFRREFCVGSVQPMVPKRHHSHYAIGRGLHLQYTTSTSPKPALIFLPQELHPPNTHTHTHTHTQVFPVRLSAVIHRFTGTRAGRYRWVTQPGGVRSSSGSALREREHSRSQSFVIAHTVCDPIIAPSPSPVWIFSNSSSNINTVPGLRGNLSSSEMTITPRGWCPFDLPFFFSHMDLPLTVNCQMLRARSKRVQP
jgi:hypothetical protein